jgi:hypothetical protein
VFEDDLKVTSLALNRSTDNINLPQLDFGAGEPYLLEGTISLGAGVPRIPNTCLIFPACGGKGGMDVAVCLNQSTMKDLEAPEGLRLLHEFRE